MLKYILIFIFSGVLTFFLSGTAKTLNYDSYQNLLSSLLNISSIIFAIIGAWIAIIYPRAIGRAFKDEAVSSVVFKEAREDSSYVSELVEIVMVSAFVLMIILIFQFSAPVFKNAFPVEILPYIKLIVFFVVTFITLSQVHAVFRVILANYFFLNQLRVKDKNSEVDALHR